MKVEDKRPKNDKPRHFFVDAEMDEWLEEQCRKHGLKFSAWARWLFTKLRKMEQRGEIDLCP